MGEQARRRATGRAATHIRQCGEGRPRQKLCSLGERNFVRGPEPNTLAVPRMDGLSLFYQTSHSRGETAQFSDIAVGAAMRGFVCVTSIVTSGRPLSAGKAGSAIAEAIRQPAGYHNA